MNQYSLRYVKYTYQTKYLHDNLYDMLLQYEVISILSINIPSKTIYPEKMSNYNTYLYCFCGKFIQRGVNLILNKVKSNILNT